MIIVNPAQSNAQLRVILEIADDTAHKDLAVLESRTQHSRHFASVPILENLALLSNYREILRRSVIAPGIFAIHGSPPQLLIGPVEVILRNGGRTACRVGGRRRRSFARAACCSGRGSMIL